MCSVSHIQHVFRVTHPTTCVSCLTCNMSELEGFGYKLVCEHSNEAQYRENCYEKKICVGKTHNKRWPDIRILIVHPGLRDERVF